MHLSDYGKNNWFFQKAPDNQNVSIDDYRFFSADSTHSIRVKAIYTAREIVIISLEENEISLIRIKGKIDPNQMQNIIEDNA